MGGTTRRQRILNILKILVGFALLILSVRGVDWSQLSNTFKTVNPLWLVGGFISMISGLLLKIYRWVILMNKFGLSIPFRRVGEAYFFGQVVNILLPTRGGDVVRLGIVSARDPAIIPHVTATIALEKFIDLVALVFIALGVATYLPPEASLWLRQWLLPSSGLGLLAISVIIFLGPQLWKKIEQKLSQFAHPWILRGVELIDKFVVSSLWLRNVSNLLPLIGITILIWLMMLLNSLILFRALSLNVPITAGGLVLVLGYIRTALQLPPGSVGPFYFFAQLGVTTFGADSETALVFAIMLHALVTLTPIIASGVLLATSGDTRNLLQLVRRSDD